MRISLRVLRHLSAAPMIGMSRSNSRPCLVPEQTLRYVATLKLFSRSKRSCHLLFHYFTRQLSAFVTLLIRAIPQKAVARQVNSAIFLPRWAHHPPPPPQLNESAESLVPVPERETGGREDLVYAVACSRQEASDPSQSSRQLTTVSTPGVAVGEGPRFGSDQDGPHQEDHMLPSLCARKGCNTPAGYQEVLAADAGDAHSGGTGNVTERMVYWCAAHRSSRSEMGQWAVCSYSGCRLRWCWGHVADTGTMQSSTGRCSYHKEDG